MLRTERTGRQGHIPAGEAHQSQAFLKIAEESSVQQPNLRKKPVLKLAGKKLKYVNSGKVRVYWFDVGKRWSLIDESIVNWGGKRPTNGSNNWLMNCLTESKFLIVSTFWLGRLDYDKLMDE